MGFREDLIGLLRNYDYASRTNQPVEVLADRAINMYAIDEMRIVQGLPPQPIAMEAVPPEMRESIMVKRGQLQPSMQAPVSGSSKVAVSGRATPTKALKGKVVKKAAKKKAGRKKKAKAKKPSE